MESKKDIRKRVLTMRNEINKKDWEEKSHLIYEKVVTHPFFLSADSIYCYIDYRNEVGTRAIIEHAWNKQKKVAVPKVEGDEMSFYYIDSFLDLCEGFKGILEPKQNHLATPTGKELVIMPGAAFDRKCGRIGYGKGYYDKYLSKHPHCKRIALGFDLQIVDDIPTEPYDICPECVITEEHIYEQ